MYGTKPLLRAAFILLITGLCAATTAQAARDESTGLQDLAVAYYANKHHVTSAEARARIEIQDRATGIEDALAEILGDQFAGVWFDHDDYGRLKIGLTDSARTRSEAIRALASRHGVDAQTDLVPVSRTQLELDRLQDSVRSLLMDMITRGLARTSQNPKSNSVVVTAISTLASSDEARIAQFARTSGVTVRRWDVASLNVQPNYCIAEFCDPPLRGARFMKTLDDGWCTAGFTARHKINKNHRLLFTAGHCIHGMGMSNQWYSFDANGGWRRIGPGYGYSLAGGPGLDIGVIRSEPGNDWTSAAPLPMVIVEPTSINTWDWEYEIESDSTSTLGKLLCMTGGYTGTACAEVSDLGADHHIESNGVDYLIKNMGELDTCHTQYGDSGAPIYKKHVAYGIHLTNFHDATAANIHCHTGYQGIRAGQRALNVELVFAEAE